MNDAFVGVRACRLPQKLRLVLRFRKLFFPIGSGKPALWDGAIATLLGAALTDGGGGAS